MGLSIPRLDRHWVGSLGESHLLRCCNGKREEVIAMAKRLYVGNLPWSSTSASLEALFSAHGEVKSAEVVSDRETGRSRGFGFVEMATDEGGQKAIDALNGTEVDGRAITVNEARERAPRPGGGGGRGPRSGGGRGGYGGGRDY
jgi:cold-inducible RNA-binding protein